MCWLTLGSTWTTYCKNKGNQWIPTVSSSLQWVWSTETTPFLCYSGKEPNHQDHNWCCGFWHTPCEHCQTHSQSLHPCNCKGVWGDLSIRHFCLCLATFFTSLAHWAYLWEEELTDQLIAGTTIVGDCALWRRHDAPIKSPNARKWTQKKCTLLQMNTPSANTIWIAITHANVVVDNQRAYVIQLIYQNLTLSGSFHPNMLNSS